jgi:hypothetical protein
LRGCSAGITDESDLLQYTIEMGSMISRPCFMKISTGIQAILRFFLSNLRGCNVGITVRRDL